MAVTEPTEQAAVVRIGEATLSVEYATKLVGRLLWKQTSSLRTQEQHDEVAAAITRWLVALSEDPDYAAVVMLADAGRTLDD